MARLLAQGFMAPEHAKGAYTDYVQTIYPFSKKQAKSEDSKMIETVEREIAKGPISFAPIQQSVSRAAVKRYAMSDEARQKLNRARRRDLK